MHNLTICGSMDFFEAMTKLAVDLRSRGYVVWLPAVEETKVDYTAISDEDMARAKSIFIDVSIPPFFKQSLFN